MTPDHNRRPWLRIGSRALACTLLIAVFLCLVPPRACGADPPDRPRRILIIPSYNFDYKGIQWFLQGVMAEFIERKPFKVTFFLENMQLSAHPSDRKYMDTMAASLKIKYSLEKPDLIIVQYKQALQFMERYGKEIFGDVPVVFAGLSVEGYIPERLSRNYTGIVAAFSAKKNIELILRNHPDVKKIYVVGGSSPVEHNMVQEAIKEGMSYRGKIEFIALNDLTFPALLAKLGTLGDDSVIVYQALQLDAAGKVFVPAQAAIEIAGAARVPVYGLLDTYMGSGITGGFLINHDSLGRRAAKSAMEWLQSGVMPDTRVKNEPIGSYQFDGRQLHRWGIKEDRLPTGSKIEFKTFSVWDSYKKEILIAIFLLLLQAALIIGLLWNRYTRIKTEKELRESEERFRASFERSTIGKSLTSPDGKLLRINKAFADMLGYTIEEIQQINFAQITHPDDVEEGRECLRILLAGEQTVYQMKKRYIHKSGDIVWANVSTTLLRDEHGTPLYLITSIVDITERKRAEEALRESEASYKQLFDSSPSAIYRLDFRSGKYLRANDLVCEYFGCSREEITSRSPYDILTDESKQLLSERLNKMSSGEKVTETPEYEVIDKNGRRLWLQLNSKNIYDSEGLMGADVVAHDITERRHAEDQLHRTLESLRKAFGTTVQVMVATVEARDPYTAGHQIRSADLARAIATEMGLPQDRIDGIRMAGSIHDIGKLSIPAEILSKPTRLTEIEFSLIKEHSLRGYDILKDVESPWPLAQIVYQHHERMNGSGYPRNLKGEEILMEARILAVADVVESMASHRPYRPALGLNSALEEIESNRGRLYDADAVDACLRLFREKDFKLERT
jgi:PAS domain S-box-containing protein